MPVTLEEIAKVAGFSVPTVSRALTNSKYPINPATRQRIVEVAQTLGYKPNLAARGFYAPSKQAQLALLWMIFPAPLFPPLCVASKIT